VVSRINLELYNHLFDVQVATRRAHSVPHFQSGRRHRLQISSVDHAKPISVFIPNLIFSRVIGSVDLIFAENRSKAQNLFGHGDQCRAISEHVFFCFDPRRDQNPLLAAAIGAPDGQHRIHSMVDSVHEVENRPVDVRRDAVDEVQYGRAVGDQNEGRDGRVKHRHGQQPAGHANICPDDETLLQRLPGSVQSEIQHELLVLQTGELNFHSAEHQ